MRLSSMIIFSLMISALFILPVEALASKGKENKDVEVTTKPKVEMPTSSASDSSKNTMTKKVNQHPEKVDKVKSSTGNRDKNKMKTSPGSKEKVSNNLGGKVKKQNRNTKVTTSNGNQQSNDNRKNKQKSVKEQTNKQESESKDMASTSISQKADKLQAEKITSTKDTSVTGPVNANQDSKSRQDREPFSEPNQPVYVSLATSETPISGSGGSNGLQISVPIFVKANVVSSDETMQSEQSQFWGSRLEILRNQWVNAPPFNPPIIAS
ncbi:hypothetical protein [Aquibacillus saliphilus]|uniref:hypothetical protein n=1 Tax=Aquibacillus saliphilus TaxID=1909422 RepID=UPI001CF01BAA|nr:hypothetical protein [Aquibacillus saliphilus]